MDELTKCCVRDLDKFIHKEFKLVYPCSSVFAATWAIGERPRKSGGRIWILTEQGRYLAKYKGEYQDRYSWKGGPPRAIGIGISWKFPPHVEFFNLSYDTTEWSLVFHKASCRLRTLIKEYIPELLVRI